MMNIQYKLDRELIRVIEHKDFNLLLGKINNGTLKESDKGFYILFTPGTGKRKDRYCVIQVQKEVPIMYREQANLKDAIDIVKIVLVREY